MNMRKFSLLIFLLSISLFWGCDILEELDVDIDSEITRSVTVDLSDKSGAQDYEETILFDASDDPELAPYLDKINDYTIESMSIRVLNYNDLRSAGVDNITFNGQVINGAESCTLNFDVTEKASSGDVIPLDGCSGTLVAIANDLAADNKASITLKGAVNDSPVKFDIEMTVKVKVNAAPLK